MGSSRKRMGPKGVRWTALYYDARRRQRSAGSFATKRAADGPPHSAVVRTTPPYEVPSSNLRERGCFQRDPIRRQSAKTMPPKFDRQLDQSATSLTL
jgi:hypothetical protein